MTRRHVARTKNPKRASNKPRGVWLLLRKVTSTVAALVYIVTAAVAVKIGIVPLKYLLPALLVVGVVVVWLVWLTYRSKTTRFHSVVIVVLSLLLIAAGAYALTAMCSVDSFVSNIQTEDAKHVDVAKPFVVYISGIDSTENPAAKARSDVNILAVVNPAKNQILLVNTPRDYYVTLAGYDAKDKLTHAGVYGVETSMATLANLYGVPVEHYLRINFSSLVSTIDVLGGVDVVSDSAFSAGGYSFEQGTNHVDGKAALAFSRERYSFEGGDRMRGQNQQRVIEAVIRKLTSPKSLANYQSTLATLESSLLTNMNSQSLQGLIGRQIDSAPNWQVDSISVDGTGASLPTYSMGAQPLYVMLPDQATVDAAKQKMGTLLQQD